MSKHETKMTRWYAKTRYPKDFLMEEYLAWSHGKTNGKWLMDGVIIFRKTCVKHKLIKGERIVSSNQRTGGWAWGSSGRVLSHATWALDWASRS